MGALAGNSESFIYWCCDSVINKDSLFWQVSWCFINLRQESLISFQSICLGTSKVGANTIIPLVLIRPKPPHSQLVITVHVWYPWFQVSSIWLNTVRSHCEPLDRAITNQVLCTCTAHNINTTILSSFGYPLCIMIMLFRFLLFVFEITQARTARW